MSWEDTFKSWAQAPGKTEQDKCENAVTAVQGAIAASASLNRRNITAFTQGSYRNRTNVRAESDVDVCIQCDDTVLNDFSPGVNSADFRLSPATYRYAEYKRLSQSRGCHFIACQARVQMRAQPNWSNPR